MVKKRIEETREGIRDGVTVEMYDKMQRRLRDKGWMETRVIIESGIESGSVLEIGPGPGYLGLEWLQTCNGSRLTGCEISENMIRTAERNAAEYGLTESASYVQGNAMALPFKDGSFDGVFTNGSLHEWAEPSKVLFEIWRVLKTGGRYFISDLRRDISPFLRWIMKISTKEREMKTGLISSINAAYTEEELKELLSRTPLSDAAVTKNAMGLSVYGTK